MIVVLEMKGGGGGGGGGGRITGPKVFYGIGYMDHMVYL